MKHPFAYVLFVGHAGAETEASLHRTLDEAEETLRALVAAAFVTPIRDDEIVEVLAEDGTHARIFACTSELEPFARSAKAA